MSRLKRAFYRLREDLSAHPVEFSLFFICLISFLVYSPLLFGSFLHFDDGQQIFDNLRVKQLTWVHFADAVFTNYTGKGSAPSFALSMLNWAVTPNYAGFAVFNLAWLMGLILLFYRFSALFLSDPKWRLVSTLLFSVHSLNADALGWMSSRCHIMGATFILCCFIFWQKYQDDIFWKKRILWYILAILSAAVAVWNKGIFLVIPGLIVAYDFYRRRRIRLLFFLDKIPLGVIAYLPLLYTPLVRGAKDFDQPGIGLSIWTTLMNDAGLVLEYLYRLAVPGPTAVSIDVYPVSSLFDMSDASSLLMMRMPPIFNIAAIALLFALSLLLFARYKEINLFYCYIFILIALSPVMNIPRRWVDFAFRFEQMPLFFFSTAVGSLGAVIWPRLPQKGRIAAGMLFACLVFGHIVMSVRQARYWSTELSYWTACGENFPDSIVCRNKASGLLVVSGKPEAALEQYRKVHQYSMYRLPNRTRDSARDLGTMYRKMGNKEDALFYFKRSLLIDPLKKDERQQVRQSVRSLEQELKKQKE